MKEKTCCFSGHRIIASEKTVELKEKLYDTVSELINQGYVYFGAGGALGFDTMAAETVLSLKEKYPDIKLILVLPCKNQTRRWRTQDKLKYEDILSKADKVIYISDEYTPSCMHERNRHLVDASSVLVCYLISEKGGTRYTVNYAAKKGLEIINLAESF